VTYPEKDGLIMMGDLPRWNDQNMNWSHCDGWPTQMEDGGLIVIGDLPRKSGGLIVMGDLPKERWWSHCDGRPTQMKDDVRSHCYG
jgi:hypothetical protein